MTISDLFFADLVRVAASGTGVGPMLPGDPFPGHRGFAGVVPAGAVFPYAIAGISHAAQWEVGTGTLDEAGRIVRTPASSSNGGAAVDFAPGLKSIALTPGAAWLAAVEGHGHSRVIVEAGSASVPSIGFADDPGSGLFRRAGNGVGIATGNFQRVAIDGEGRMGVGADPIPQRLTVAGSILAQVDDSFIGVDDAGGGVRLGLVKKAGGMPMIATAAGGAIRFVRCADAVITQPSVQNFATLLTIGSAGEMIPGADNVASLGNGALRFSAVYAASGAISTSDAREKTDIEDMPEAWLDAWGAVAWRRYKFAGRMRWHVGLVAQAVHDVFAAQGLDAFAIGLCCRDRWEDEDGATQERWGLRYDECFALEAAWTRRALQRLIDAAG